MNKINWNGVDKSKLIRLLKDVFAKLNQEKIRHYNELHLVKKRLLDKNLDTWSMNKDENLFYILQVTHLYCKTNIKGAKKMKNSEILYLYDAKFTNPNGDPDEENRPRMDYEREINLVSDLRLKR